MNNIDYSFITKALSVVVVCIVLMIIITGYKNKGLSEDNIILNDSIVKLNYKLELQQSVIDSQRLHFKDCSFIRSNDIEVGHDNYLRLKDRRYE